MISLLYLLGWTTYSTEGALDSLVLGPDPRGYLAQPIATCRPSTSELLIAGALIHTQAF